MKKLVTSYTFDASAKTVTLDAAYKLEQILLITNIDTNDIIYNFANQGGSIVGNVLTLDYDTTWMYDGNLLQIWVDQQDMHLLDNSTATPLAGNGTWVGTAFDTLGYGSINYSFISDKPTATNGLYVEFSDDGTNWDKRIVNTYDAAHAGEVTDLSIRCHSRYMRMGIVNGSQAQTYVRLNCVMRLTLPAADTMGVDHAPVSGDDALLTKSVIAGVTTAGGGAYVNVKVNPSGALTTATTVDSSVLPTGASTSANQTNGNQITKVTVTDETGVISTMLGDTIYAGAPVIIDVPHHEIHCGDSFTVWYNAPLGNNITSWIHIIVPNEAVKKYHLTVQIGTGTEVTFAMYEAGTTSANGTALTWVNRERNLSAMTSGLLIYHTPTITANGTQIDGDQFGAKQVNVTSSRADEWVLKNNTKYLLAVTNGSGNTSFVSWKLNHYIHPGI